MSIFGLIPETPTVADFFLGMGLSFLCMNGTSNVLTGWLNGRSESKKQNILGSSQWERLRLLAVGIVTILVGVIFFMVIRLIMR
jgi:hypothetical protein